MKLKKNTLISQTINELSKGKYHFFRDSITPADGLFIKKIDNDLFLSLGFTISKYYNSQFTASFYLSKTTRWGSMWGDIPKESFERVGVFLNKDERKIYLNERYNVEGVVDAWWDGDKASISKFIEAVVIAEDRFLSQPNLIDRINNSDEIKELVSYSSRVIKIITAHSDLSFKCKYLPGQKIDDIDIDWFKAAEITLLEMQGILNSNTVKHLAADSYRQWILSIQS